jgi:ATP-dependent DNA helicase RecG
MIAVTLSCYYKRGTKLPKERKPKSLANAVSEVLCGLANANGGTLILGVEKDGSSTGIPFPKVDVTLLKEEPKRLVDPPLALEVEESERDGEFVLLYKVHPGPYVHRMANGKCFLRVGDRNVSLDAAGTDVLHRIRIAGLFERQHVLRASLEDLDRDLLQETLGKIGLQGDPIPILRDRYRLLSPTPEEPRVTMGALLLFGRDILHWHPRPGIDFVRYEGTEVGFGETYNVKNRVRIEGPLVTLVDETMKVVQSHLTGLPERYDLFYSEKFEYPLFVLQEAIVNAVAHRDYSLYGTPIEVRMFDNRLEVRSPGGLPKPFSLSEVVRGEGVHFARNPLLVHVLYDLEYMRDAGTGIPKMVRTMEENGQEPPEFRTEATTFSVTLIRSSIFDEATREWLEKFTKFSLNGRQFRIIAYAKSHGMHFASSDYQSIGRVDRDTAYREIREMTDLGIVVHKGGPGARTYEVKEPE